jgi:hypothetical protein
MVAAAVMLPLAWPDMTAGQDPVRAAAPELPAFVEAAERRTPLPPGPAQSPGSWLIAHVDIETTGLVPGWHEAIDVGVVLTELDGSVRDSFFVRVQPLHPERTSDGARAVNAFDADAWRRLGALDPAAAADSLVAFHQHAGAGRAIIMAAWNSQFDAAFLDHLMRTAGRSWREIYHYFVLDVPSMAWALGLRDLVNADVAAHLDVEDEPRIAAEHTGLTGAMLNVRIYQALVRRARAAGHEFPLPAALPEPAGGR